MFEYLPNDSKHNIAEIIDGKLGQGLLDLPRSEEGNRQDNRLFRFNLLRCLRMDIWESTTPLKCPFCKQDFDTKGDHLYQCSHISKKTKTRMHNKWRDMWHNEMQSLIPFIQLTDTKIEKEAKGLIRSIKKSKVRPFDTHFNLPIISNEGHFRCKLSKIGFDIITCNSDTCPSPSRGGSDAKSKLHEFSLGVKDLIHKKEHRELNFIHEFSSKIYKDDLPIVFSIKIEEITGKMRRNKH